jgi:O-antigen/teichoic acid export membrane protein
MSVPRRRVASPPDASSDPHFTAVARGGALNFVGVVASAAFGFAFVVVVTRGFTSTQVGLFFEAVALFNLALSIAVWGADVGLVRTIPRFRVLGRERHISAVVRIASSTVFWLSLSMAAAMYLFAPQLSALLTRGADRATIEPLLRACAPFLPIAAVYAVLLAATRGLGKMGPTNAIDRIGRAGLQFVIAMVVASAGMGTVSLIVGWAVPYAIGFAVAGIWAVSLIRQAWRSAEQPPAGSVHRVSLFAEFWRFTLPRGLAGVFAVTVLWLDTLLIGALRSTQDAGVYAAATRYLVFGAFASQAVILAIAPTMSELLTRHDMETARSVYRASTAWAMVIGWPVYLMLAIFAPALLSILGPGYAQAQDALTILALTMLVASGVGAVDIVLLMGGKSAWNLLNTVAAVVLNITLNVLLIPRLGITGAAVAWSVSILANNLAPLVQVRIFLGLHPLGRETITAAAASLFAFGLIPLIVRAMFAPDLRGFSVAVVLGGVVYGASLWRFRSTLIVHRLFALRGRQPILPAQTSGHSSSDV